MENDEDGEVENSVSDDEGTGDKLEKAFDMAGGLLNDMAEGLKKLDGDDKNQQEYHCSSSDKENDDTSSDDDHHHEGAHEQDHHSDHEELDNHSFDKKRKLK